MQNVLETQLPELLTVNEVAQILRCDPRSVRTWIAQADLPCLALSRKQRRIPTEGLRQWLEIRVVPVRHPDDPFVKAIAYLSERDKYRENPLCPRCAKREQSDSGLCTVCEADKRRAIEERADQERARKLDWWHSEKGRSAKDRRRARRNGADDA